MKKKKYVMTSLKKKNFVTHCKGRFFPKVDVNNGMIFISITISLNFWNVMRVFSVIPDNLKANENNRHTLMNVEKKLL